MESEPGTEEDENIDASPSDPGPSVPCAVGKPSETARWRYERRSGLKKGEGAEKVRNAESGAAVLRAGCTLYFR